jgi:hypothetical protein
MRFALSVAAAACGLLLLGLAFFGQPEAYLRQAREQWVSLTEAPAQEPAPSQAASPANPEMATRVNELQQQVLQLRDELIARREEADRAREALALAQAQQQAAEAQRQVAEPAPSPPQKTAEQPPVTPLQPQPQSLPQVAQAVPTPEHQDAVAPPVPDRHEPPPPAERHAAPKPSIAAPRQAPRQDTENTQSVLARLRQASPVAAEPADAEPAPERMNRGPSPVVRRLIAARAALANGQIEETRRLLQEAQLELVFRPAGSPGDDPGSASRAASDVAHALEALSGADLSASRGYIDRALGSSDGSPAAAADRGPPPPVSGYAPAYPER